MKTEQQIRSAEKAFSNMAVTAKADGDHESYEVLANIAMALRWVLEIEGGQHVTDLLAVVHAIHPNVRQN